MPAARAGLAAGPPLPPRQRLPGAGAALRGLPGRAVLGQGERRAQRRVAQPPPAPARAAGSVRAVNVIAANVRARRQASGNAARGCRRYSVVGVYLNNFLNLNLVSLVRCEELSMRHTGSGNVCGYCHSAGLVRTSVNQES